MNPIELMVEEAKVEALVKRFDPAELRNPHGEWTHDPAADRDMPDYKTIREGEGHTRAMPVGTRVTSRGGTRYDKVGENKWEATMAGQTHPRPGAHFTDETVADRGVGGKVNIGVRAPG